MKLEFSQHIFEKRSQISNFTKIRPAGAEFFHANKRTEGWSDITKLMVAFCKFAKAPRKCD